MITLIYIAKEFRHNAERTRLDSMAKAVGTQVRQFARLADEPNRAELEGVLEGTQPACERSWVDA